MCGLLFTQQLCIVSWLGTVLRNLPISSHPVILISTIVTCVFVCVRVCMCFSVFLFLSAEALNRQFWDTLIYNMNTSFKEVNKLITTQWTQKFKQLCLCANSDVRFVLVVLSLIESTVSAHPLSFIIIVLITIIILILHIFHDESFPWMVLEHATPALFGATTTLCYSTMYHTVHHIAQLVQTCNKNVYLSVWIIGQRFVVWITILWFIWKKIVVANSTVCAKFGVLVAPASLVCCLDDGCFFITAITLKVE